MRQAWAKSWFFAAPLLFVVQCSNVWSADPRGHSEEEDASDDQGLHRKPVSDADAADWLERTLWGPDGARRWRHHGLLGTHRLRLQGLQMLHIMPKANAEPAGPHMDNPSLMASTEPPPSDDEAADDEGPAAGDDDDLAVAYDGDGHDDVLSAGLRRTAFLRQQAMVEQRRARAAEAKRRAESEEGKRKLARRIAHESAKKRKAKRLRAERNKKATREINMMLKEAIEEMDLEKTRCRLYLSTAQKEASAAHDTATEDQETLARIDTTLHASQADMADIEGQMSEMSEELKSHKARCATSVAQLRAEMGTLVTDANATTNLMSASPCKGKVFLFQCQRDDNHSPYVASQHRGLRQVMAQLSTRTARRSLQRALRGAVQSAGAAMERRTWSSDEAVLLQQSHHRRFRHRRHHQRSYNRRVSQCRVAATDCNAVENAIVLMMADVQDKQRATQMALEKTKNQCDVETTGLEREVAHFVRRQEMINQQVAQALAQKSTIQREVTLRLQDYQRLQQGLANIRQECESSAKAYEGQLCTLKRTRKNFLHTTVGSVITTAKLQDCEVSPWVPAQGCSEECGGGVQTLIRTVVVPAGSSGMPCPALQTRRTCNVQPCAVDCRVSGWTGWSECSAICGGGVRTRYRRVVQMARHGGEICPGQNDNSEACNTQPCTPDCVLDTWTHWSTCSRACNGGFQRRVRLVSEPVRGNAVCPTEDQRSEFRRCTPRACPSVKQGDSLKCNSPIDLTVVLDASSSVNLTEFADAKTFVSSLFQAMDIGNDKAQAALVIAGGPKTWKDFQQCRGRGSSAGALASCGVSMKLPLSSTQVTAVQAATQSVSAGGPAYIAGGLSLAAEQVEQGRREATPVVLVLAHGRPLSESRTEDEASRVRKAARLLWLVVDGADPEKNPTAGSRVMSTEKASTWSSRPYSDNVFAANSFQALKLPSMVSELVSAICPSVQGSVR